MQMPPSLGTGWKGDLYSVSRLDGLCGWIGWERRRWGGGGALADDVGNAKSTCNFLSALAIKRCLLRCSLAHAWRRIGNGSR